MRKSILRFGALALMSLMSISSWAQPYRTPKGSVYQLDGGALTATLTSASNQDDWSGDWKFLTIGEDVYKVTEVYNQAFASVSGSEHKVTIPSTLERIGVEAFKGVTIAALGDATPTFTFPTYLQLGEGAFENATFPANTTIDLGNRPSLPEKIFNGSNNITYVLCTGLKEIPDYAFADCEELLYIGSVTDGKYYLPKDLSEVGEHAFDGCKNLSYIKFKDITSRIKVVGDYAFKNCKKFDDSIIKNVCGKFDADLTYGKGSFYGCSLETVDLEASTVKVTAAGSNPKYSKVSGVPECAFYGNKIKSLKLPTNCVAIEANAFASNYKPDGTENTFVATLDIPTLPSALEYIEANAFDNSLKSEDTGGSLSAKGQNSLSLPQSLKSIGADAFNNRNITTIYASAGANKDNVPELKAQTILTVFSTVIPSVVWKDGNLKSSFEGKGWKGSGEPSFDYNVRYAQVKDAPTTVTCDYVDYAITLGADGVYIAKPTKYKTDKPTIYGQFDKAAANVKSEGSDNYPLTFKVENPTNQMETAFVAATDYTLTFSPKVKREGSKNVDLNAASYTLISSNYVGTFASQIKKVYINDGITNVAENVFEDTKITTVELPKSIVVAGLGTGSFATNELKTVTVNFDKDKIPAAKGAFTTGEKQLVVKEGTKATREDYLAKGDDWETFFNTDFTVKVTKVGNDAPTTTIATIDEVKGNNVTRVYELHDANDVKELSITSIASPTETPAVRYYRTFTTTNFQCWYVPFEFEYTSNDKYTFYYINNSTTKNDFTAEAAPFIELKEVKSGTKIKANTPYVIKPKVVSEEPIQFYAAKIENTASSNFTVTSALNKFEFTGTYVQKLSNGTDNWYGVTGGNFTKFTKDKGIQAYRFYMEMAENEAGPYYNAPEVKFVVLDEDATSIEDVKSGSLSAPMFDLMGRQITSPAKGQVYIQNGVKKLAK